MLKRTLTLTILLFCGLVLPSSQRHADARGGADRSYTVVRREQQILKDQGVFLRDILISDGDQSTVRADLLQNVQKTKAVEKELQVYYDRRGKGLMSSIITPQQEWMFPTEKHGGITAGFKEASYREYFGIDHDGTDFRMKKGTILKAPKDGIVIAVSENGYGFNWIEIEHRGFRTLYGHVYDFLVEEGDRVYQGQPIGLSGGKKGDLGSGRSTGEHLHLEVRNKEGELIDPETLFHESIIATEEASLKRT